MRALLGAATSLLSRISFPGPSTVQVVGDVYLDVIANIDELPQWDADVSINAPIETVAGGSALNTAVQLSALLRTRRQRWQERPFRRCVLHSRVGRDLYGGLVAAKIREAGVTLSARRAGGQGVCICLSGKRDRAFVSYKGSVADLTEDDIDVSRLLSPGTSHVHFSAYYDCSGLQPAVPRLVERAKADCGATVSLVPQSDSAGEWDGALLELLPHIDLFICNQREAAAIAGVNFAGRRATWEEIDEAVRRLHAAGAPLVVVTLGADGALAATPEQWWFQPNQERPVVDTTGCGDVRTGHRARGRREPHAHPTARPTLAARTRRSLAARSSLCRRVRARAAGVAGLCRWLPLRLVRLARRAAWPRVRLRMRSRCCGSGGRLDTARRRERQRVHAAQRGVFHRRVFCCSVGDAVARRSRAEARLVHHGARRARASGHRCRRRVLWPLLPEPAAVPERRALPGRLSCLAVISVYSSLVRLMWSAAAPSRARRVAPSEVRACSIINHNIAPARHTRGGAYFYIVRKIIFSTRA
jgi:sugar/nucleoside kinase (ribokinase family)